tara:strand:+ start:198 stop:386 length:189 start_codon:yes stop_codon:yes gene_type:complete
MQVLDLDLAMEDFITHTVHIITINGIIIIITILLIIMEEEIPEHLIQKDQVEEILILKESGK